MSQVKIEDLSVEQVKEYNPALYDLIREEEGLDEVTEADKTKIIEGLTSGNYKKVKATDDDKKSVIDAVVRGY